MRLTDVSIKSLKAPGKGQVSYADDSLPGFAVRVSQGGTRTFVLVHGRDRTRISLGRYPIISLAEARAKAKAILAEKTLGIEKPKPALPFEEAMTLFLQVYNPRKQRTKKDTTRLLNTYWLPALRGKPLTEIDTDDITKVTDRLLVAKKLTECRNCHAAARLFFRWATRRRYIKHSPVEGLQSPARPNSRARVLSDAELAAVLTAALRTPYPFGPLAALLVLLGQRRGETGALRWEWIDDEKREITLPPEITKNGREHVFPYGDMTAAALARIPRTGPWLFPSRGNDKPYSGWSKAKATFDKRLDGGVAAWTLHDLRRTLRTKWAEFGILREVAEKYINHISGAHAGVEGIYNRFQYLEPMREAVRLWERKLISLTA